MSDLYQGFTSSAIGKQITAVLGLPQPTKLERYAEGAPLVDGTVAVGGRGRLAESLVGVLDSLGIAGVEVAAGQAPGDGTSYKGLVFDATGLTSSDQLVALRDFFTPLLRSLGRCPRVVVIGTPPEQVDGAERVAQRALEGFTRSLGKEIGRGGTVQLVYVADGADADDLAGDVRRLGGEQESQRAGDRSLRPGGDVHELDGAAAADLLAEAAGEPLERALRHPLCAPGLLRRRTDHDDVRAPVEATQQGREEVAELDQLVGRRQAGRVEHEPLVRRIRIGRSDGGDAERVEDAHQRLGEPAATADRDGAVDQRRTVGVTPQPRRLREPEQRGHLLADRGRREALVEVVHGVIATPCVTRCPDFVTCPS